MPRGKGKVKEKREGKRYRQPFILPGGTALQDVAYWVLSGAPCLEIPASWLQALGPAHRARSPCSSGPAGWPPYYETSSLPFESESQCFFL